jgi:hypothetical protein
LIDWWQCHLPNAQSWGPGNILTSLPYPTVAPPPKHIQNWTMSHYLYFCHSTPNHHYFSSGQHFLTLSYVPNALVMNISASTEKQAMVSHFTQQMPKVSHDPF